MGETDQERLQHANTKLYPSRLPAGKLRLVRIHQGTADATVVCSFAEYDFRINGGEFHAVDYKALSYVCGTDLAPEPITCNGEDMYVTQNLLVALKELHRRKEAALLWIDAVSINQADDIEKTEQVKMMGQIFANAVTVI
jgi:Heterokaryon incompatibility protein (HET)